MRIIIAVLFKWKIKSNLNVQHQGTAYILVCLYSGMLGRTREVDSVQFSRSVVSDSLRPHESQHASPPCPSPTPGVHSNSCPSSQWCHPAISSSVVPFSSCPQSLPASASFPVSQLFAWGGQNTGVSASASFLPKISQGWSPSEWTGCIFLQSKGLLRVFSNESTLCMRWLKYWSFSFSTSPSNEYPGLISLGWTGWISLQSKGLSRVFSNTTVQKHQFFGAQPSSQSNSHIHTRLLEKP